MFLVHFSKHGIFTAAKFKHCMTFVPSDLPSFWRFDQRNACCDTVAVKLNSWDNLCSLMQWRNHSASQSVGCDDWLWTHLLGMHSWYPASGRLALMGKTMCIPPNSWKKFFGEDELANCHGALRLLHDTSILLTFRMLHLWLQKDNLFQQGHKDVS